MKIVVMIPTFNEKDNIIPLIDNINSLGINNLEILVVDDNSPDGTWKLVENKKKSTNNLFLLRRFQDKGRGTAGIAGFKEALRLGAERVIEMDGDFSHDPVFIPALLKCAENADLAIGSRFVEGGKQERQSTTRNVITKCAVRYIRFILGFNINDPTSGYRCFRRETLEKINLNSLKANDAFVVSETLYRCKKLGLKIKETPITFKDRAAGKSKLGSRHLIRYLFRVLKLRFSAF
jgi:dolichol-phosphate mannosyltransferase